jgi:3-oxoacyl-(acyl-carrier-protein) synthase
MDKKVVITGIGVISPNSIGKDNFKEAIRGGVSGIKNITLFDTSNLRCKTAGEIRDFNPQDFLGPKGLRNLNRSTTLTLAATKLAFDDAKLNYPVDEKHTYDYGVSIGTATGSLRSIMSFDREILLEGPASPNPAYFPNTVMNVAASYVSIWFNIKGFNTTIASGLCSGMDAVFYGMNMIKNYDYKVVIAGGVDELCLETFLDFYKLGILSGSNDGSPESVSCPYDRRRNGAIFAEGASVLVLEELEYARARGAKIYAGIGGYGSSFDAKCRKRRCDAGAGGAVLAIKKALARSGTEEAQVDYICGSANSTPDLDLMEVNAIKKVFGKRSEEVLVSSVKSMLGEAFSAGSVFGISSSAIAIDDGFIPPTINYNRPDEKCGLNIVKNRYIKADLRRVLVNSFSPTGTNSAVVLFKTS